MDRISGEIFEWIFTFITEPTDLVSLRAVNRYFRARFTPSAFQIMRFRRITENSIRFRKIVSIKLSHWVKDLCFDVRMNTVDQRVFERYRKVFDALNTFINVRSVTLNLWGPWSHDSNERHRRRSELQLLCISSVTKFPTAPTSLTIVNFRPVLKQYFTNPGFQEFLGGLTYFSMSFCRDYGSGRYHFARDPFWNRFAHVWLKPMEGNIQTLIMGPSCGDRIPTFPMQSAELHFTKLVRLELHQFQFPRGRRTDIETFVMSEPLSVNLKHLALIDCSINSQGGTNSAGDTGWAAMIARLQVVLKGLKGFEIGCLNYEWGREIFDEDKNALNSLWQSIGQLDKIIPVSPSTLDLTEA